ncbi:hypothetical protein DASC09_047290 [Saccharomycopsis crataegensis]|uniref:Uncharacterized protein n=1 Tax=Saccharomycopsis crataegensis TaxID=43959 RepID=A0AAV5QRM7_9ASCO|nr:hypothetical protein DASC09_047290 [Saccharomycopsis crataegensis]
MGTNKQSYNPDDLFAIDKSHDIPTYELDYFSYDQKPAFEKLSDPNIVVNSPQDDPNNIARLFDYANDSMAQESPSMKSGAINPFSNNDTYSMDYETLAQESQYTRRSSLRNSISASLNRLPKSSSLLSKLKFQQGVSKSFYIFIAISIISSILILPLQIFLIVNTLHPSSFNGNTRVVYFTGMALAVCSSLLIFSRVYQVFITLTALITKNTIQALYLLIYMALIFVSSANYMLHFPKTLSDLNPEGDHIITKFATYWIIAFSALALVTQFLLFWFSLRKELSWQRFRSLSSSISTRTTVLAIQNYKALIILNGFFIIYDLVISMNFPYHAMQKRWDTFSRFAIFFIVLTPMVLTYLYFISSKRSIASMVFGMVYMLLMFIFSVISSYSFNTFAPFLYTDPGVSGDNVSSSEYYSDMIYPFRGWFSVFHYALLGFNFSVSIYLVKMFYEENAVSTQSTDKNGIWNDIKSFFRINNEFSSGNILNSQYFVQIKSQTTLSNGSAANIKAQIFKIFKMNVLIVVVAAILGVSFTTYTFKINEEFFFPWFLASLISITALLSFSIWSFCQWRRSMKSDDPIIAASRAAAAKYLLLLSIPVSFVLLNGSLYHAFFVANLCLYYGFDGLFFIYSVPQSNEHLSYYYNVTVAKKFYPEDTALIQEQEEAQELFDNTIYYPLLRSLNINHSVATGVVISMCVVALISMVSQAVMYARVGYLIKQFEISRSSKQQDDPEIEDDTEADKLFSSNGDQDPFIDPKENDKTNLFTNDSNMARSNTPESLSTVSRLYFKLRALMYFNLYLMVVTMLLFTTFPYNYYNVYIGTVVEDTTPTFGAVGGLHAAYFFLMVTYLCVVAYVKSRRVRDAAGNQHNDGLLQLIKLTGLVISCASIVWIPMICYEFSQVFIVFNYVFDSYDMVDFFYALMAALVLEIICFLASGVLGGFLWWKVRKERKRYEKQ